jgi:hypothetical protein
MNVLYINSWRYSGTILEPATFQCLELGRVWLCCYCRLPKVSSPPLRSSWHRSGGVVLQLSHTACAGVCTPRRDAALVRCGWSGRGRIARGEGTNEHDGRVTRLRECTCWCARVVMADSSCYTALHCTALHYCSCQMARPCDGMLLPLRA